MGMFDRFRTQSAVSRLAEEALYAEAMREIESGIRRDGIWAMALAEANMDQSKAAARYIKLRVQSLKDEIDLTQKVDDARAAHELKIRQAELDEGPLPIRVDTAYGVIEKTGIACFQLSILGQRGP